MKRLILMAVVWQRSRPPRRSRRHSRVTAQVNGRAEKEITPDEFYLQIIINERDSKGKISVESQQRDMIAALKRCVVSTWRSSLKVANLSSEFFKKKKTSVATAKYQLQLGTSAELWRGPGRRWTTWDFGLTDSMKVSHSEDLTNARAGACVEAIRNARGRISPRTLGRGGLVSGERQVLHIYDSN